MPCFAATTPAHFFERVPFRSRIEFDIGHGIKARSRIRRLWVFDRFDGILIDVSQGWPNMGMNAVSLNKRSVICRSQDSSSGRSMLLYPTPPDVRTRIDHRSLLPIADMGTWAGGRTRTQAVAAGTVDVKLIATEKHQSASDRFSYAQVHGRFGA